MGRKISLSILCLLLLCSSSNADSRVKLSLGYVSTWSFDIGRTIGTLSPERVYISHEMSDMSASNGSMVTVLHLIHDSFYCVVELHFNDTGEIYKLKYILSREDEYVQVQRGIESVLFSELVRIFSGSVDSMIVVNMYYDLLGNLENAFIGEPKHMAHDGYGLYYSITLSKDEKVIYLTIETY